MAIQLFVVGLVGILLDVIDSWEHRETYNSIAELLIVSILAMCQRDVLRQRDVLWFADNQAALSCLVKATASRPDLAALSLLCSLALAHGSGIPRL